MEKFYKRSMGLALAMLLASTMAFAQTTISGVVKDGGNGETLAGVNIVVKGTILGTISNMNGEFKLVTTQAPPLTISLSFIGFSTQEIEITDANTTALDITLQESSLLGQEIVVSASKYEESIMTSPVSIEKMNIRDVQSTASENYYKGLVNLKGLDMSTSSINFQIINARGFASTGNTRFVQLTDGMDTQAPALNFPIGNLNGPSELDVESVEFLPGASSALYGPNAFNGILLVNSKSPFEYQGLSAFIKGGLNHIGGEGDEPTSSQFMGEASVRFAKAFNDKFAFKVNVSYSKAQDWYGTNYNDKSPQNQGPYSYNPGADLVHQFGDEASTNIGLLKFSTGFVTNIATNYPAFLPYVTDLPNDVVSRSAYKEKDLVDYGAKNLKIGGSLHYRINDKMEVLYALNYGGGTSVYTGAQRYSLKNFSIIQHKVELRGKNFFLRAYTTQEDSGDSYIADLLGFRINESWSNNPLTSGDGNSDWFGTYGTAYLGGLFAQGVTPGTGGTVAQREIAHQGALATADAGKLGPESEAFKDAAKFYKKTSIADGGTKFEDKSALYHGQGQYDFTDKVKFLDGLLVGASYRLYDLNSNGTIFADVEGNDITISEYGAYTQLTKVLGGLKLIGSVRYDKNENFDGQFSPRIAGVYTVAENHNFRASYQTGFRNPTTQAQHIDLNVVSAQLIGGLPEYAEKYNINYNTYTMASVTAYTNAVIAAGTSAAVVDPANIALLQRFETYRPIQPEEIATFEVGYKGLLDGQKMMIDLSYYHNTYTNFEYQTRLRRASGDVSANAINASSLLSGSNANTYQVYTNAEGEVKSMGATVGLSYNLPRNFTISTNYNWNKLDKGAEADASGIYQFNTPEHKVNFTLANRKITERLGFATTVKWQKEFIWEGSFAVGEVPAFTTLDAQVSYKVPAMKSVVKIGGSNILNERYIMNYGSPTLGAIYYVSVTFDQFFN